MYIKPWVFFDLISNKSTSLREGSNPTEDSWWAGARVLANPNRRKNGPTTLDGETQPSTPTPGGRRRGGGGGSWRMKAFDWIKSRLLQVFRFNSHSPPTSENIHPAWLAATHTYTGAGKQQQSTGIIRSPTISTPGERLRRLGRNLWGSLVFDEPVKINTQTNNSQTWWPSHWSKPESLNGGFWLDQPPRNSWLKLEQNKRPPSQVWVYRILLNSYEIQSNLCALLEVEQPFLLNYIEWADGGALVPSFNVISKNGWATCLRSERDQEVEENWTSRRIQ